MNQYGVIVIDYDELVKIIKSSLIQEENTMAPIDYKVYYVCNKRARNIFVSKEVMIGKIKGKLVEEITSRTIGKMVLKYIEAKDYFVDTVDYITEKISDNSDLMIIKGVRVKLVQHTLKERFIKEL